MVPRAHERKTFHLLCFSNRIQLKQLQEAEREKECDFVKEYRITDVITRLYKARASLVAHKVKHLPTMQETWVQSLGQEDPCRRKWQPTSVLLPGESHGGRSLVGYSPWGHKELDTTERLHFTLY